MALPQHKSLKEKNQADDFVFFIPVNVNPLYKIAENPAAIG